MTGVETGRGRGSVTLMFRAALLSLTLGAWVAAEEPGEIAWSKDLATARAQAARDGRPVLLYFTFET